MNNKNNKKEKQYTLGVHGSPPSRVQISSSTTTHYKSETSRGWAFSSLFNQPMIYWNSRHIQYDQHVDPPNWINSAEFRSVWFSSVKWYQLWEKGKQPTTLAARTDNKKMGHSRGKEHAPPPHIQYSYPGYSWWTFDIKDPTINGGYFMRRKNKSGNSKFTHHRDPPFCS